MMYRFMNVLVIALVLIGCSRQKPLTPKPAGADEPEFQKPSATESFNLRTKCAELGEKINGEYDLTGIWGATSDDLPYPFTQEHFSHYDPKANRCYVELRATASLGSLNMANAKAVKNRDYFLARYEVDYLERRLYDGQTGEELASLQKGVKGVPPTGVIKGRLGRVEWFDAANEIDNLMADDRKR